MDAILAEVHRIQEIGTADSLHHKGVEIHCITRGLKYLGPERQH